MNLDQIQQKNNQLFLVVQDKSKLQQSQHISQLFKNNKIHEIISFLYERIIDQFSLHPNNKMSKILKNQMIKSGNYVQKKHLLPIHIIQIIIETFYSVKENMKDLLSNLIKQSQNKDQKPNKSEQTLSKQAIAQSCIKQYKSLLSNVRQDQAYIIIKWSRQIHQERIISENKPIKVEKQIEMEEQKKQKSSYSLINVEKKQNQQMLVEQKIDKLIKKTKSIKKNKQVNKKNSKDISCQQNQLNKKQKQKQDNEQKSQKFKVESKFKICPHCKVWVQKTAGCSSIKCRCGKQFCYNCGGTDCPYGNCRFKQKVRALFV